jgi:hypothetical protein
MIEIDEILQFEMETKLLITKADSSESDHFQMYQDII